MEKIVKFTNSCTRPQCLPVCALYMFRLVLQVPHFYVRGMACECLRAELHPAVFACSFEITIALVKVVIRLFYYSSLHFQSIRLHNVIAIIIWKALITSQSTFPTYFHTAQANTTCRISFWVIGWDCLLATHSVTFPALLNSARVQLAILEHSPMRKSPHTHTNNKSLRMKHT